MSGFRRWFFPCRSWNYCLQDQVCMILSYYSCGRTIGCGIMATIGYFRGTMKKCFHHFATISIPFFITSIFIITLISIKSFIILCTFHVREEEFHCRRLLDQGISLQNSYLQLVQSLFCAIVQPYRLSPNEIKSNYEYIFYGYWRNLATILLMS